MTTTSPDTPVALTIAGSDPSGGAGLQADLKTFHQFGVYGMSVVTLLTVQNTVSVTQVELLDPELLLAQLNAVLSDIPPQAAKTGALGNRTLIEALAAEAPRFDFPLVVDPVMISKHGMPLIADDAIESLVLRLLPHVFLVTPNIPEAARITGRSVETLEDMETAAQAIADMGVPHVLIKGGHRETSQSTQAIDVLWTDGKSVRLESPRTDTPHTHGTGCVTSAAITANLAAGKNLKEAVQIAKQFVTRAIEEAPGLGKGHGPVNLLQ